jgi:hypothetical protein
MAEGAFDKDFGYLVPFLDKVAASASTLSDPAAREELARLMVGEKQRWLRIRELLAGAAGKSADGKSTVPAPEPAASPRPSSVFTVGSLRPGKN